MPSTPAPDSSGNRQSPRQDTRIGAAPTQYVGLPTLYGEAAVREALGLSERKFKQLRAAGVVPDPLLIGPRTARWTAEDVAQIVANLPRRERQAEPQTLAEGRRQRIERLKAG